MDSFFLSFVHPKQDPRDLSYLARTLYAANLQARYHGRLALREKLCEECLTLCHELADKSGMAVVLHEMGQIAYQRGRSQEAISLYGESLALFQEQGDQHGRAETLLSLAETKIVYLDDARIHGYPL
jgi:tetratricopeptide (TPR) repeat protein